MIKGRKEKQFLIFSLDDGKEVKYDLSKDEVIGKSGKIVKNLCSQLRGETIEEVIDSFYDENYRTFLFTVYEITSKSKGWYADKKYSNVGTLLKKINSYSHLEQYYAIGLRNFDKNIKHELNEVPKGLLKLVKEKDIKLNDTLINNYKANPNLYNNLLSMDFMMFKPIDMLDQYYYRQWFVPLVETYNYKPQALCTYIDNIMTYEGIETYNEVLNNLYDYTRMMNIISKKFDKYPRYLLSVHKIAIRNYNRLKQNFKEELFVARINKSLEFSYKNYKVIYPKSTQDIKDEAVSQQHCVASYIDKVIEGYTNILFLRKKDELDKSLITLEVKQGKIVQARGKFNREPNEEEQKIIEKYKEMIA